MKKKIVMLASLDTKAQEASFLKECIELEGGHTILVDIGYGRPAEITADISVNELARAAGSDMDSIYMMDDTDAASQLITQGAIIKVHELFEQGRCDGIIAFGGTSNTALASSVMEILPIGIPKFIISSAVTIPAYAANFFRSKDIAILHSVVDISGLNDLTRAFLKRGAGAICGMVHAGHGPVRPSQDNDLIAVTSNRFADDCSHMVMDELQRLGYTPIPFHAQGVGENAMEDLITQGMFLGVVDIVPAGLSEEMLGGNRAARSDRLQAAGQVGIPQVISLSGFDMISCGPIERRDSNDPLWQKLALAKRQYTIPDRFRVEARTTSNEVEAIARRVAEKLNQARAPACVMVPTLGWSSLSVEGSDLYNPDADAVFVPALKKALTADIEVIEMEESINSEPFALAMATRIHRLIKASTST